MVLDVASSSPLRFDQRWAPVSRSTPRPWASASWRSRPTRPTRSTGCRRCRRFTDRTITDRAALLEVLAGVREQGWALNDGEPRRCADDGVPVLRLVGTAAGAVAVQGPSTRLTDGRIPEVVAALRSTATSLAPVLAAPSTAEIAAALPAPTQIDGN